MSRTQIWQDSFVNMAKLTPKQVITELEQALQQFGTYAFNDKGAHEVMDLDQITQFLLKQKADKVVKFLVEVKGDKKARSERESLASQLICSLDDGDWSDEEWEAICAVCPGAY